MTDLTEEQIQERVKRAQKNVKDMNQGLVKHRIITLTVEVTTEEQAEQLFGWMYSSEHEELKAKLLQISWEPPMTQNVKTAFDELIRVVEMEKQQT